MKKNLASLLLAGASVLGCTTLNSRDYILRKEENIAQIDHDFVILRDDIGIHYIHVGHENDRKVMLLHGLCMSSWTWRKTIPFLSDSFNVYAIDFVGFGFSSKPTNFNYSIKEIGEVTREFMDVEKIDKASMVGNSLGAGVGVYLAVNYPKRVESLVLVDSIGAKVNEPLDFSLLRMPFVSLFFENPNHVINGIENLMYNPEEGLVSELKPYGTPYETHSSWESLRKTLSGKNPEEAVGKLMSKIDIPTLIISGTYDWLVPPSSSRQIGDRIADSHTLLLPSGHFPQEEVPGVFNRAVYDFLDKYVR